MPTGRPTVYTDELGADIASRLACGESVKSICNDDKMPCRATIYLWLSKNETFLDMYVRGKEDGLEAMNDNMLDIADDGTNDWMEMFDKEGESTGWKLNGEHVQRSKLRIDTRKWYMAKIKPNKYGDNTSIKVGGDANNPIVTRDITETMDPIEAARIYKELTGGS